MDDINSFLNGPSGDMLPSKKPENNTVVNALPQKDDFLNEPSGDILQKQDKITPTIKKDDFLSGPSGDMASKKEETPVAPMATEMPYAIKLDPEEMEWVKLMRGKSSGELSDARKKNYEDYISKKITPEEMYKKDTELYEQESNLLGKGKGNLLDPVIEAAPEYLSGVAGGAKKVLKLLQGEKLQKKPEEPKTEKIPEEAPVKVDDIVDENGIIPIQKVPLLVKLQAPAVLKNKLTDSVLAATYNIPLEDVKKGRLLDIGAPGIEGMAAKADQVLVGFLGDAANLARTKWEGVNKPDPSFFSQEIKDYIAQNYNKDNNATVNINGIDIKLPTGYNTPEEALNKLYANYVGAIRDIKHEATRSIMLENLNILSTVATMGGAKVLANAPGAVAKTVGGLHFLNSPIQSTLSKYGAKLSPALTGKISGAIGNVALQSMDAALPAFFTQGVTTPADIGRAMAWGAVLGTGGELAGKLAEHIHYRKEANLDKKAIEAINNNTINDVNTPQEIKDRAVKLQTDKTVANMLKTYDPNTMSVALEDAPHNPEMQKVVEDYLTATKGVNIEQYKDQRALKGVIQQIEDAPTKNKTKEMIESPAFLAAAGDVDRVSEHLTANGLEHLVEPYKQQRGLYLENSPRVYRDGFIDMVDTAIGGASVEKLKFMEIDPALADSLNSAIAMSKGSTDIMPTLDNLKTVTKRIDRIDEATAKVFAEITDTRVSDIVANIEADTKAGKLVSVDDIKKLSALEQEIPSVRRLNEEFLNYNDAKIEQNRLQQKVYAHVVGNTFTDKIKETAKSKTGEIYDIAKSFGSESDPVRVAESMNKYLTKTMEDPRIPQEIKTAATNYIQDISTHVSKREAIPKEKVDAFRTQIEQLGTAVNRKQIYNLVKATEHWNKEINFVSEISNIVANSPNTPHGLIELIPAFQQAAHMIVSPRNIEAFRAQTAFLSNKWREVMKDIGLPEKTKLQLFQRLFGDDLAKLKTVTETVNPIPSAEHAQNMIEVAQYYTKQSLDILDNIMVDATGNHLDRNTFMAMFATNDNMYNVGLGLEKLGISLAIVRGRAGMIKELKRSGNVSALNALNMETLNYHSSRRTLISVGDTHDDWVGEHKEAPGISNAKLGNEVNNIINWMQNEGATNGMTFMLHKLEGSIGIYNLKETFVKETPTGIVLTPSGELFKRIFTNPERLNFMKEVIKRLTSGELDLDIAKQFIINEMQYTHEANVTTRLNAPDIDYAKHFLNYFKEDLFLSPQVTTKFFEDALHGIALSRDIRIKGNEIGNQIRVAKNKQYAHKGIAIQPKRRRAEYVHTRKAVGQRMIDNNEHLYYQEDLSGRFKSSQEGQLLKANKFDPHTDALEHPLLSAVQDAFANIRDANTAHSRMILEDHGLLLKDLGFEAFSAAYFNRLTMTKLQKMPAAIREFIRTVNPFNYGIARPVGYLLNAFTGFFGRTSATLTLSAPKALGRAVGGQALMNMTWSKSSNNKFTEMLNNIFPPLSVIGKVAQWGVHPVMFFKEVWKNYFGANKNYMPSYISLEAQRHVNIAKEGYRDQVMRNTYLVLDELARVTSDVRKDTTINKIVDTLLFRKKGEVFGSLERAGLKGEKFANWASEAVSQKVKEGVEVAMSTERLQTGAAVYEDVLRMYETGATRKEVIEFLSPFMKAKNSQQIFHIAGSIERAVKGKDGYAPMVSFLRMFHQNSVGSFGPLTGPVYLSYISAILPSATRYFVARTNNSYRQLGTTAAEIQARTQEFNKLVKNKYPLDTCLRLMWGLGLASGISYGLNELYDETGVDLRNLAPSDVSSFLKLKEAAKSKDLMTFGTALVSEILDMNKQRGIPFFTTEAQNAVKSLKELNNIIPGGAPVIGRFMQSEIEKKELAIEELQNKLEESTKLVGVKDPKTLVIVEQIQKAQAGLQKDINYARDNWVKLLGDYVAGNAPFTAPLLYGTHPYTVASMYANEEARELVEKSSIRYMQSDKPFVGYLSLMGQAMGLQSPMSHTPEYLYNWMDKYYEGFAYYLTPEQRAVTKKVAMGFVDSLVKSDRHFNKLVQDEYIGGKKELEAIYQKSQPEKAKIKITPPFYIPETNEEVRKAEQLLNPPPWVKKTKP